MEAEKLVILFSGYNDRGVIAFARTLRAAGVRFAIVARNSEDPVFLTDYSDRVVHTRSSDTLDRDVLTQVLDSVRKRHTETSCWIAPSTEALNRFLLKERPFLEEMRVRVPLVAERLYSSISDKYSFGEICREFGILVPAEYPTLNVAQYPFVAKPKKFRGDDGAIHTPFLIFDSAEKSAFIEECDTSQFFYQEFVDGRSVYLLYYFRKDGSFAKLSQENVVQQPGGKSILAAVTSDFHEAPESTKYEALFKSLEFRGLVMVEVKVSASGACMIEANPRFWGPSQLFIDAGLNLFEELLYDHEIIAERPGTDRIEPAKYFWHGGLKSVQRESSQPTFHRGTENEFLSALENWIAVDIYRRDDTMKIYLEETK
jgi:predicted ATP-grasp superfamily ATP-dependent carboligase